MRKIALVVVLAVAVLVTAMQNTSFAADQTPVKTVVAKTKAPIVPSARPAFGLVAGDVVSIYNADPENIKIAVKSAKDQTIKTISATQKTNVTKMTDVSEIKVGENVRMMTRKIGDKEIAIGILFGKMKALPMETVKEAQSAAKKEIASSPE